MQPGNDEVHETGDGERESTLLDAVHGDGYIAPEDVKRARSSSARGVEGFE